MRDGLQITLLVCILAIGSNSGTAVAIAGPPPPFWAVAASGAVQERRDIPSFKAQVELVTVDAVVVDSNDRPVRGLKAEDFTIVEDGRPQAIATFEAFDLGDGPEARADETTSTSPVATNRQAAHDGARSFILLVDDMSLAPSRQEVVRAAIGRFGTDGLRDGDQVIIATTSGDAWWSASIPEGRDDLLAIAARVRGRSLSESQRDFISEWEAYRISNIEGTLESGDSVSASGEATGPPGPRSSGVPGVSLTRRVVDRYYDRRMCIPPPETPATPYFQCRAMVTGHAHEVDMRRANRTRDAVAAVDRAVFALSRIRGRKSLLLLTEGFLNDPGLDIVQQVAGRCREANIVVYSLDVRGLMTGLATADEGYQPNAAELSQMQMESIEAQSAGSVGLAEETGGFAARNTNDIGGKALRIAGESRTYYLLGYAPPEGKGPRDWRKLKVEVNRPGLLVRARKGYTLRTSAEIQSAADAEIEAKVQHAKSRKSGATPADPPLPTDVARALANGEPADAIPLRAMAYALDGRPGGTIRTVIAIEADMRSLANLGGDDQPRSVLNLSISATHRDTGKTRRIDQRIVVDTGTIKADASKAWGGWLAVSRDLDLPPGVNQARIVVRDEFLGRLGAVTLRVLVPAETGLRISTLLITDRLFSDKTGGASRPVLVAHRNFAPRSPLYCQFQVFGAALRTGAGADVEASYLLRQKGGSGLRRSEPSPMLQGADGRLVGVFSLPMEEVPQGDYELILRVEDKTTGQIREAAEPLRIG